MNRLPRHPLVVTAVAFSLVCVLYAVGIHLWPVGADYAETNSQSNQIRLSVWLYGPPVPAVLVGTAKQIAQSSSPGRMLMVGMTIISWELSMPV